MKPTYKESYDKIIEAYFSDEIKPLNAQFCFCGTLCDQERGWFRGFATGSGRNAHFDFGNYSGIEYFKMEQALLNTIRSFGVYSDEVLNPNYETALFAGMSAGLDVLKQIHIERGEVIDDTPAFTKRILQSTTTN